MIESEDGGNLCISTPWNMRRLASRHVPLRELYTAAWRPWDVPKIEDDSDLLELTR